MGFIVPFFAGLWNSRVSKHSKRQCGLIYLGKDKEIIRLRCRGHQNYYQERGTAI